MGRSLRADRPRRSHAAILAGLNVLAGLLLVCVAPAPARAAPVTTHCGVFDVIVVGSEPEGIAAAVAAAETGSRTLLVSRHEVVGGLFTVGQMNVLDLRTQPFDYQLGLFERWWQLVGRRHSFDVDRALQAFESLLAESGVHVSLAVQNLTPVQYDNQLLGIDIGSTVHFGAQLIDATADMDFAAAAGAPHTVGFESLGLNARMADTLVFRIGGVDWQELREGIQDRGAAYAAVDNWVAWGHFGRYPADYQPVENNLRLRGLNLGRQEDGTLLVNALLIYGVDPFDEASRAEGRSRAEREAARIVEYLSEELPGFANATYAGSAPGLYVRESRHLEAQCMLTIDDVLDNRVTPQDVAAGGYPLDVQTLTPSDNGFVYGVPDIYGVRLCSAVPVGIEQLWVVGKAAGFDPLAASSARVVPFGMAFGEAVGVAASLAVQATMNPAQLVADDASIQAVRTSLLARGAVLPEVTERNPVGPHEHPAYEAMRTLITRGLAVLGYENDPRLDEPVPAMSYVYMLSNIASRFLADDGAGKQLVSMFVGLSGSLTIEIANEISAAATCLLHDDCAQVDVQVEAAPSPDLDRTGAMTRGEMYRLAVETALPEIGTVEATETRRRSYP